MLVDHGEISRVLYAVDVFYSPCRIDFSEIFFLKQKTNKKGPYREMSTLITRNDGVLGLFCAHCLG